MIATFFDMLLSGVVFLIVWTLLLLPLFLLIRWGLVMPGILRGLYREGFFVRTPATAKATKTKTKPKATPVKAKHSVVDVYSDKYKLPPNAFE